MNLSKAYGYYKEPKSTEDQDRDKYNATIKAKCTEEQREAHRRLDDALLAKEMGITVEELNANRRGV